MSRPNQKYRRNVKRRPRRKARSKLADKKINTLVEKRMAQIAKAAATSARQKTYRDYVLGSYNNSGWPTGFVTLSQNPDSTLLSLYALPVHDEDSTKDITSQRLGNNVWVRGFRVSGCLRMQADSNDMADCQVQLVLFSQRRQVDPLTSQILSDLPSPVVFNGMAGSLPDEDQKEDAKGITILARKTVSIRPTRAVEYCRSIQMSHYFKKPQPQMFEPTDTDGLNPLTRSYWLCAFTDRDLSPTAGGIPVELVCNARAYFFVE